MNNLAEQLTAKTLPLSDVIQQISALVNVLPESYNAEIAEYEELAKYTDSLEHENTFLKLQVQNLTKRVDSVIDENEQLVNQRVIDEKATKALTKQQDLVIANAEKINQKSEQHQREAEQARNELKDLRIQLKAYKEIANSPKKVRDKIKDLQARLVKEKGFTEQHKKNLKASDNDVKKLKKEVMSLAHKLSVADIIQLHGDEQDKICLFPHQLGDIAGYENGQVPLLYMHASGRASLVLLNNDGEAELPAAPKGGLRPKKATLEHCGQLLRRFKSQGWTLTDSDVKSIAMQN